MEKPCINKVILSYLILLIATDTRGGGTPSNGLYGEAPPFRLQVYKRVGISRAEVYERVGKSVI